jgi:hypothetical protein
MNKALISIFVLLFVNQHAIALFQNNDEYEFEEVIVTGSRITDTYDIYEIPAVRLVKRADFMIQEIRIVSDSRKEEMRRDEIHKTIFNLLKMSEKTEVFTLGTGEDIFVPLDRSNYKLVIEALESKTDTSQTRLLVKASLDQKASANQISSAIHDFIEKADLVGRAEILKTDELGLSIVNPERYRSELLQKLAADIRSTTAVFGEDYRVTIEGLNYPVLWERQGLATMVLYIPYNYEIVPKEYPRGPYNLVWDCCSMRT